MLVLSIAMTIAAPPPLPAVPTTFEVADASSRWAAQHTRRFRILDPSALQLRAPSVVSPGGYFVPWSPVATWRTRSGHLFALIGTAFSGGLYCGGGGSGCTDLAYGGGGVAWQLPRSRAALMSGVTIDSSSVIDEKDVLKRETSATVIGGVLVGLPSR